MHTIYTSELMTMTVTTTNLEINNWLMFDSSDITILCTYANNYGNVQSRMYKITEILHMYTLYVHTASNISPDQQRHILYMHTLT